MVEKKKVECSDGIVREFTIREADGFGCDDCKYQEICEKRNNVSLFKEISKICNEIDVHKYPICLENDWPEFFLRYRRPKIEKRI